MVNIALAGLHMHGSTLLCDAVGAVPIAGVVTPRPLSMLRPVAKAQPAELITALAAHHVHAALVLLYWALALGAGLGVG